MKSPAVGNMVKMNLFLSFLDTFNKRTKRSMQINCDDEQSERQHGDNMSECKKYARAHGL